MERGIAQGELDPKMDVELALALLIGPMMYSYVFLSRRAENRFSSGPGPEERSRFAEGVVDAFWRAFSLRRSPARRARRS
jgi:hypothetical protein